MKLRSLLIGFPLTVRDLEDLGYLEALEDMRYLEDLEDVRYLEDLKDLG